MGALARANQVRLARARLKRRIADGELSAAEVLLAPARETDGLALVDLLRCQPHWGAVRSRRFAVRNAINERKPIGQLTARQRALLAAQLTEPGPGAHEVPPQRSLVAKRSSALPARELRRRRRAPTA